METTVTTPFLPFSISASFLRRWRAAAGSLCVFVAACGGGADAPPPPESAPAGPAAITPVITQQPASLSVTSGQPASFTVAATGTAPLAYQWQRNGSAIAGATAATYAIAATAPVDTGAVFRAVVSNVAGSATSNNATLSISVAPPVLTITQQPANTTVAAGASATFTVAATCSSGTLVIQWQRAAADTFADIAGASSVAYTLTPAISDTGAQFRATLSCSGQTFTQSSVATLTVTAPPTGGVLSAVPINGLRTQARLSNVLGIVREPSGSYAFVSGSAIRRLAADLLSISLVAGSDTATGSVDGVGGAAQFSGPVDITADGAGNLYVIETSNVVRRIATDGTVSTLAGLAYTSGATDGTGNAARFNAPAAITTGPDGDLYVAEFGTPRIRRVTTSGVVSVYAGDGTNGLVDGAAATARFQTPKGLAFAADGTLYVSSNGRLRSITRVGNAAGVVATFAGNGTASDADGVGVAAGIPGPRNMIVVGSTLYVRDGAGLVRAVDLATATVSTVAGRRATLPAGISVGYADGPIGAALIDAGTGSLAATGNGRLILTDAQVHAIRLVAADGYVTTLAADDLNTQSVPDATGVIAQHPLDLSYYAMAAAADGTLYVGNRYVIRRIATDGTVTPAVGLYGSTDNLDGSNSAADLNSPTTGMAFRPDGKLAFMDVSNVRFLDPATNTVTAYVGAAERAGTSPGSGTGAVDGQGATARFQGLEGIVVAPNGDMYGADRFNYAIRKITPAGVVTTFSGVMGQPGSVDGTAAVARFANPIHLALAPDGSLWVLDDGNTGRSLRRVAPDGSVTTLITSSFIGGPIAIDPAGTLYITGYYGLVSVNTTTGALTTLIPIGSSLVLGNSPQLLGTARRMVTTGVKQLVFDQDGRLVRATLP